MLQLNYVGVRRIVNAARVNKFEAQRWRQFYSDSIRTSNFNYPWISQKIPLLVSDQNEVMTHDFYALHRLRMGPISRH